MIKMIDHLLQMDLAKWFVNPQTNYSRRILRHSTRKLLRLMAKKSKAWLKLLKIIPCLSSLQIMAWRSRARETVKVVLTCSRRLRWSKTLEARRRMDFCVLARWPHPCDITNRYSMTSRILISIRIIGTFRTARTAKMRGWCKELPVNGTIRKPLMTKCNFQTSRISSAALRSRMAYLSAPWTTSTKIRTHSSSTIIQ